MKALAIKTFAILLSIGILVMLIIVGSTFYWYNSNTQPLSISEEKTTLTINKGTSFAQVAEELESKGIIKNAFAFRVWAKLSGEEITVQAGTHTFSPSMSLKQVADQLAVGIQDEKVLIKEGVRVEEIAEILERTLDDQFKKDEFIQIAKPYEGMLFPNTYILQKSSTANDVFKLLNQEFEDKYAKIGGPTDQAEKKRIVTLASMLEREGVNDADRAIIAGILSNRLKDQTETVGLLQVDATLQYAINQTKLNSTSWWPVPTPADKEINSMYNTYKFKGMPPGPICNPGLSALKAALKPQPNNYMYYIHDKTGKAYYARTLDEHNNNIAKYLQ